MTQTQIQIHPMTTDRSQVPSDSSEKAAYLGAVLDRVVAAHTRDDAQVVAARRLYEDRRGRVFEDEERWEGWSAGFVEWFVTEHVAPGQHLPLAAATLASARAAGDARCVTAIRSWLTSHRSLWSVEKLGDGFVDLFDLLGGAQVRVAEPRSLHGVAVGEVAELRVIGFEDEILFGRAFLFHPRGTRAALLERAREITTAGGDRRAVLDHAALLRTNVLRYRHVPAVRLYEWGGARDPARGE
jgi:hypothetical protein